MRRVRTRLQRPLNDENAENRGSLKRKVENKSIEIKLELGHRALVRDKPTPDGFTHDWVVFVKGAEGTEIKHFVEKVVFYLHESFPKPRRVVKESPYQVTESGYAGFMIPIEVYFRSKEEPKKVHFEYDLFLKSEGPPVCNIRPETLTFQNPSEDFHRKLLLTKGVGSVRPRKALQDLKSSNNNVNICKRSSTFKKPRNIQNVPFKGSEIENNPNRFVCDVTEQENIPVDINESSSATQITNVEKICTLNSSNHAQLNINTSTFLLESSTSIIQTVSRKRHASSPCKYKKEAIRLQALVKKALSENESLHAEYTALVAKRQELSDTVELIRGYTQLLETSGIVKDTSAAEGTKESISSPYC